MKTILFSLIFIFSMSLAIYGQSDSAYAKTNSPWSSKDEKNKPIQNASVIVEGERSRVP